MFNKGLRSYCMFKEKIRLEGACNMSNFLNRAHACINYDEELLEKE